MLSIFPTLFNIFLSHSHISFIFRQGWWQVPLYNCSPLSLEHHLHQGIKSQVLGFREETERPDNLVSGSFQANHWSNSKKKSTWFLIRFGPLLELGSTFTHMRELTKSRCTTKVWRIISSNCSSLNTLMTNFARQCMLLFSNSCWHIKS